MPNWHRVLAVFLSCAVLSAAASGQPARPRNLRFSGGLSLAARPKSQFEAARLLMQGTFGATLTDINAVSVQTYGEWFNAQVSAAPTYYFPKVTGPNDDITPYWLTAAVMAPDQLRQRVAFALSQILVVSNQSNTVVDNQELAYYYDILVRNAFGNYRTLLEEVTLSPAMGHYLSMFRNDKPNPAKGIRADENYAREIMQLFSVGLVMLNSDGTPQLDNSGNAIPSYAQVDVENLARVFTGWASNPKKYTGDQAWFNDDDFVHPMAAYENHHDVTGKTIIGGVNVPVGETTGADMKLALDTVFYHPNVGPFLSAQLIQRLVTSNPTPAYVRRVAAVFDNNGKGVRGDLLAVVEAILADPEAASGGGSGKLREPLLRLTHLWRAFGASDTAGKIQEPDIVSNSLGIFRESVLESPTVFNFFRPDYKRAGPLTNAGMVAPEFQITNETSLILTENQLIKQAYQYINGAGTNYAGYLGYSETDRLTRQSVMLRTAPWEPLAANPSALVDQLNLVFMAGRMPAAMKTTLVNYVTSIPASAPWSRVIEAADLVVDSPQYAVQR